MKPDNCACCATHSHATRSGADHQPGSAEIGWTPDSPVWSQDVDGAGPIIFRGPLSASDSPVWSLHIEGHGSIFFKGARPEAISLSRFRCDWRSQEIVQS